MDTLNIIIGLFLVFLGVLIKHARMYNMIAGYNTMPPDQKKNVDIEGFSTLMRNCFILMGLLIIIGYYFFKLLGWYRIAELMILFSLFSILPYLLIRGQKFDKNKKTEKVKRNQKILIGIYMLVAVFVGILIIRGISAPVVKIDDQYFKITGMYGFQEKLDKLEHVEIIDSIPKILFKSNGFALGNTYKGSFKVDELGKCRLLIQSLNGPFIKLTTLEKDYTFINYNNIEKTKEIFVKIQDKIEN